MASITWQGLTSFVQNGVAAVQAAASSIIDASTGSVTLAWQQAVTGVALWLQRQIVQVLALTRAATSNGADLDSFYADFDFPRLPAKAATTPVTLARFTNTQQAVIPAGNVVDGVPTGGNLVSTGPGGIQFMVMADEANAAYNPTLGAYVIAPGTSSISVPVQCMTPGSAGNVLANTIQSFVQGIPYVDTVTNPSQVTNGVAAESDQAYRARFPQYLAGLASADEDAIISAIQSVQQGIQYLPIANFDYPGTTPDNGSFFVIIDDGSGSPPSSLLTAVDTAIQAVRGFTIRYQGSYAPTLITPTIALNIRVASGYNSTAVESAVKTAIVNAVNAIPLTATTLFADQIADAALSVSGCQGVQLSSVLINGSNADLTIATVQRPHIAASNVTVGTY
jgi:hypothetical protein